MTDSHRLTEEVRRANERFYRAFESLDIEKMARVWVQDDTAHVIHPGWTAKYGWEEVRDSWVAIFDNTRYMEFDVTDVHILVVGDLARVTCVENLRSVVGDEQNTGQVQATNLYVQRGEQWLMVHHHGSPIFTA